MWNCTHFRHPTDEQLGHVDTFFSNYYNLQSVYFELNDDNDYDGHDDDDDDDDDEHDDDDDDDDLVFFIIYFYFSLLCYIPTLHHYILWVKVG